MSALKLSLLFAGSCVNIEKVVMRDARLKTVRFYSLCALIEHPQQKPMLFDTGYSPHVFTHTKRFPYNLYRMVTPITCEDNDSAASQVQRLGISPADIGTIFISHFHADHVGGLRDFPNATFVYPQSAYNAVKNHSGFAAVGRAFIPQLIPENFEQRSRIINDLPPPILGTPFAAFPVGYDVVGDGSIIGIPLPGHAQGQMGLYLPDTNLGSVFLVSDASWHSRAIRDIVPPHPIARLLIEDYAAFLDTLQRLSDVHHQHPEISLIPTHCQEVWEKYGNGGDF